MKNMRVVTFKGTWIALQPICQIAPLPAGESKNKAGGGCIKQKILINEGEVRSVHEVPAISANTIKSLLRNNISADMVEGLAPGTIDYHTLFSMFSGGMLIKTEASTKQRYQNIIDWRKRNLLIDLLACASPATGMMAGKVSVWNAIAITKETAETLGHESGIFPPCKDILENRAFVRSDDVENNGDVFVMLDEKGLADFLQSKKDAASTKAQRDNTGEEAESSEETTKTAAAQMIYSSEFIIQGTEFAHTIELYDPSDEEIGAVFGAFRRFARRPFIGGDVNRGCGKVSLRYDIKVTEAGETIKDGMYIDIREEKGFSCEAGDYLTKYDGYLTSIKKPEDIAIPAFVLAKKPPKKVKKSEETAEA